MAAPSECWRRRWFWEGNEGEAWEVDSTRIVAKKKDKVASIVLVTRREFNGERVAHFGSLNKLCPA